MVNTFVALIGISATKQDMFVGDVPVLLPLALLATKLCLAQAGKLVAAAAGLVQGAYTLLSELKVESAGAELAFAHTWEALESPRRNADTRDVTEI